jgi:hypothetical protein
MRPGCIRLLSVAMPAGLLVMILAGETAGQDVLPPELNRLQPWQQPQVCGANLLFVLLRAEGVDVSRDEVVQRLSPPTRGSSLEELASVARKFHVDLMPMRGTTRAVDELRPPWIAHLEGDGQVDHFVLVLDLKPNAITVLDGGNLEISDVRRESFYQRWTGYALSIGQGMLPRFVRWVRTSSIVLCVVVSLALLRRRLTRLRFAKA